GLLLHAVCQRNISVVDGADIENEVGLELEQRFEVGRVAAPGEPSDFGLVAGTRAQQRALRRLVASRPSAPEVGGERVKEDRRRGPGSEDALDPVGNSDGAAGRVSERGATRKARCN